MSNRIVKVIYKFEHNRKRISKNASCEEKLKSHCHAFVVSEVNEDYCQGFMLTHATTEDFPEHKLMQSEYFIEGWPFQFDNTYFLRVPLIKINSLATVQIGLLTAEALQKLVSDSIGREMTWEEYIRNYCK